MGKTPAAKRLVIVAYPPVSEWPELAALAEKGHEIIKLEGVETFRLDENMQTAEYEAITPDLILGPTCWRMDEPLRKYLETAIKAARKAKK